MSKILIFTDGVNNTRLPLTEGPHKVSFVLGDGVAKFNLDGTYSDEMPCIGAFPSGVIAVEGNIRKLKRYNYRSYNAQQEIVSSLLITPETLTILDNNGNSFTVDSIVLKSEATNFDISKIVGNSSRLAYGVV